jgi:hypothetical protein
MFKNKMSENKMSENKMSENKMSKNKMSKNKMSENKMSKNKMSKNKMPNKKCLKSMLCSNRPCLSPKTISGSRVLVAVRIDLRQDVPVELFKQVRLFLILNFDQLLDHEGDHGRSDPFAGVDSAVNPHSRLVAYTKKA